MNICTAQQWLVLLSAAAASVAAATWLRASLVKAPAPPARFSSGDELLVSVSRQSRLNAWAALFAGIAALLQFGYALIASACWS
jgi:hypothetical protein